MTAIELIKKLSELPPDALVKIAFDMGIRMDAEICKPVNDNGERIIVLTNLYEWNDRENW